MRYAAMVRLMGRRGRGRGREGGRWWWEGENGRGNVSFGEVLRRIYTRTHWATVAELEAKEPKAQSSKLAQKHTSCFPSRSYCRLYRGSLTSLFSMHLFSTDFCFILFLARGSRRGQPPERQCLAEIPAPRSALARFTSAALLLLLSASSGI